MALDRDVSQKMQFGWEIIGLIFAGTVPIFGVLFYAWDAHAVMFILSCEVIALSAVLAYLFN